MSNIQNKSRAIGLALPLLVGSFFVAPSATAQSDLLDFGLPVCVSSYFFGGSNGLLTDVDQAATASKEVVALSMSETIKQDTDADGLGQARLVGKVELFDAGGTSLWTRTGLGITTNDVIFAAPFVDSVLPGTQIEDVGSALFGSLFIPASQICRAIGVTEANGQEYIYVTLGAASFSGTLASPVDDSRVRVWLLDPADGSVVFRHDIIGGGVSLFLPFSTLIVDYDGDGSAELVVSRSRLLPPNGDQLRANVDIKSFNLTTGALENSATVRSFLAFTNENDP